MFREDSKRFYRELGKKTFQIEKPPDIGEVRSSGRTYWSRRSNTMRMSNGLRTRRKNCSKLTRWEWKDLTVEELRVNMTRAAYWKSPGPDRLPNFWIKQFKSLHKSMAEVYFEIVKDPNQTPDWLVEGATNLLPKKEETCIPKTTGQ